ncbi:MAG: pilin [Oleiphilus sp.]
MNMKTNQQGFTLIELMIVVAIIGILAAVAIPAYQDYTVRAKVTEVLSVAAAAKTSISEFYSSVGEMPADADAAGVNTNDAQSTYISDIAYTQTSTTVADVTYTLTNLNSEINTETIEFEGTGTTNGITWTCSGGTAPAKFLPANCR